ncbi:MAG: hypothetical protein ACI4T4_05930 [Limosilactobacillus sp.]
MNYQIILLCVAIVCLLLFLIQWFRQARHILHGGTRPLAWNHPALNWCLLLVAVLAVAGMGVVRTKPADTTSQVERTSSSKVKQRSSSSSQPKPAKPQPANSNRQGTQQGNPPAPEHQDLKLDQNGHAVLNNFAVPAKNQLQIIDAGSGNVLQTFPGQPAAGTVNYTFTKAGNYYLILTDGEQTKTIAVGVSR